MYEIFKSANDLIFYGLAAVVIIGAIIKMVKAKKKNDDK